MKKDLILLCLLLITVALAVFNPFKNPIKKQPPNFTINTFDVDSSQKIISNPYIFKVDSIYVLIGNNPLEKYNSPDCVNWTKYVP
jgi:hypothetical protein